MTPNAAPAHAPVRWSGVLVRFGEIGIKSAPVRRQMLERLQRNLQEALLRHRCEGGVERLGARLWLVGPDPLRLAQVACKVFGVVSVSPALAVNSALGSISSAAALVAVAEPAWSSFAVKARREGTHDYSSQDVQVQAGSAVWQACEAAGRTCKVDLSNPDLLVEVDIRGPTAYLFTRSLDGPGGIPVGSQGKAVALLSDEPSFVAAWLAMRRGCDVRGLHAGTMGSLPIDAAGLLADWGMHPQVEVLPACSGSVSKKVLLATAAKVARERGAPALVTGDGITSQLLPGEPGMAILRPVCGLDPAEYARIRDRAGLTGLEAAPSILDAGAKETIESLLSMRQPVSL